MAARYHLTLRISGAYGSLDCVFRYLYLGQLFYSCSLLKIIAVKYSYEKMLIYVEKEHNLEVVFRFLSGPHIVLVEESHTVWHKHSEANLCSDTFDQRKLT